MATTYGRKLFGLRRMFFKADSNNGSAVQFPIAQRFVFTPETLKGVFEGDDTRQGGVSYLVGGKLEGDAASMTPEALAEVTGFDLNESGSTPNRFKYLTGSNKPLPYCQAWGQSVGDKADSTYIHLFHVKLDEVPPYTLEYGKVYVGKMSFAVFTDETITDVNGNAACYEQVGMETFSLIAP